MQGIENERSRSRLEGGRHEATPNWISVSFSQPQGVYSVKRLWPVELGEGGMVLALQPGQATGQHVSILRGTPYVLGPEKMPW